MPLLTHIALHSSLLSIGQIHTLIARSLRLQRSLIALFVLLFVVSSIVFVWDRMIRGELLTTRFYVSALNRTNAFDRIYDDILSDPELASTLEPLFGSTPIDHRYAVPTLRYFAPPDQLNDWSSEGIGRIVAYVRGESPRYSGEVDVSALVENQTSALVSYIRRLIVSVPPRTVSSESEFVQNLDDFVSDLSNGEVGDVIPVMPLSEEQDQRVVDIILRRMSPESAAAIREQVESYVSLNDIIGALNAAAPGLLETEIDTANNQLVSWLGGDGHVDPAATFSTILQGSADNAIVRMNSLRRSTSNFAPRWMLAASLFGVASSIAGLVLLTGDSRRGLEVASLTALLAGAILWIVAESLGDSVIRQLAGDPLAPAFHDSPQGWGLPLSARQLIGDVQSLLYSDLSSSVERIGLVLAIVGFVGLVIARLLPYILGAARGRYNWLLDKDSAPVIGALIFTAISLPALILFANHHGPSLACNGRIDLCDVRFDEVTFVATHNSMSNSADGWLFPNQDQNIRQQLEDGVRAFLIDTHYWDQSSVGLARLEVDTSFNPAVISWFQDILPRLGSPRAGTFLCHSSCWLGAVSLNDVLTEVREFLDQHPNEVLTLIIQDGISVSDTQTAFHNARLDPYLFAFEEDTEWPTLRELIESGNRLVVMAESSSPPPEWYMSAWDVLQDTRYDAHDVSDLGCSLNRGSAENSLLLMNHWITGTPPDRVDAALVNNTDFIIQRALLCRDERGHVPNFIAVDFYRQGNVFAAAKYLNELRKD
ncbi:MAG: hypothetical protein H8D69_00275 [Chloroflexi bacterium]|nr:hypothetical protein [Chloroflexota bacterium]